MKPTPLPMQPIAVLAPMLATRRVVHLLAKVEPAASLAELASVTATTTLATDAKPTPTPT